MSLLRQIAFIARHDLSSMLRAKETLLWVFVMPLLFFAFIGHVTGGFGGGGGAGAPDALALGGPGLGGFLADELELRLEEQGYAVERVEDEDQLAARERRLVVPATSGDLTRAALSGEAVELRFVSEEDGLGADYEKVRVGRAVYGLLADLAVVVAAGEEPSAASLAAVRATPRALTLDVRPAGERLEIPAGYEQTIPGTMVMFTMLVLLTSGSILLVIERQQGLLRRLASTPIPRGAVVAGKLAGKLALGLVQIAFAMLAGTVLFRMDWGPSLAMVCVLLFVWALFNAALGILLGNLARSEAQMAGIGVVASLTLAALGGCWWPIEITPPWMQRVADFLPTGQAMSALHDLVSFGHGPAAALPELLLLLAATLLLVTAATRTFRYH